ncbi:CaiB/BaiF CoA transferase family protein [Qipengyuania flava]|uniref:CaiB/BaiF CoA transferase family protein n=1 Tax=Qipengyuania flava TaxID=192812 RepID=UPI001C63B7E4|nr:CoA transferase [Qipengyuania flava]QYJ07416.1 CoA transferase [Qipengyuania flava]
MIASGDGRPMLEGLRVVDMTSVVFGPYCTQILADFGAEVIKVEAPGGDGFRYAAKPAKTPGMSPGYIALNRGKSSLVLDLKQDSDAATLRELLESADIFIHNVRAEAIGRLGFGYGSVREYAPGIIYAHCVGFGSGGPYAGLQAYDDVIQAGSGTATLLPRADGEERPRYLPSLIADKVAGLHAAYAVMAAVIHRLRTGEGQHVEIPMFEAFSSFMLKEHLGGNTFDPPVGQACYARQVDPDRQPFPTKDGYISIVPYKLDHFTKVIALMGDEAFAREERFSTIEGLIAGQSALYGRIAELTATFTTADLLALMHANSIPAMPVRDMADMAQEPHLNASGFFLRREHPSEGGVVEMREPSSFSAWDAPDPSPAPRLGEHDHLYRKD